ncbi:MAG: ABC transporter ATP-binding protein [Parvibaculum sp.]|uniref:ABC transporter ATP-binding protein n=1 Tax=Parvibaculum sp. TaxID=2024848 RepID=UPI0025E450F4|nr:ABC transporter ATP-binding protein [Parvibaculum sp.]MCE9649132.1 ABC transporter ATP-binding protein [Parvibaculum sp.]
MTGEQTQPAAAHDADDAPVIVRLAAVHKAYKDVVAVDHVDLDVRQGEFFTLLGPSGSGKTTSLRLIAGFEKPDRGVVELNGVDVTGLPPYDRDINTVFQDYALFPHMTVAENIAYGLQAKGVGRDETKTRVAEALRMVRLADYGDRSPAQLSGGQRQRVGLARAIVNRPKVLLLDEPLGALDLKLRQEMQSELKRIQAEVGITFIYVTHDQEEALTMSDRIAIFNLGRIVQTGTPVQVYEEPADDFVAGFVGTSNILNRDGKRLILRPEKIRIVAEGQSIGEAGLHVEAGRLVEAVYVGQFTRYLVALADGTEIVAVRQNLDRSTGRFREAPGTKVQVAWRPDSLFELRRFEPR